MEVVRENWLGRRFPDRRCAERERLSCYAPDRYFADRGKETGKFQRVCHRSWLEPVEGCIPVMSLRADAEPIDFGRNLAQGKQGEAEARQSSPSEIVLDQFSRKNHRLIDLSWIASQARNDRILRYCEIIKPTFRWACFPQPPDCEASPAQPRDIWG